MHPRSSFEQHHVWGCIGKWNLDSYSVGVPSLYQQAGTTHTDTNTNSNADINANRYTGSNQYAYTDTNYLLPGSLYALYRLVATGSYLPNTRCLRLAFGERWKNRPPRSVRGKSAGVAVCGGGRVGMLASMCGEGGEMGVGATLPSG